MKIGVNIKKLKKYIFCIGVLLFFLSGTLYVTDSWKQLHNVVLLAGVFCLWYSCEFNIMTIGKSLNLTFPFIAYILFSVSIALSLVFHFETSILTTVVGLWVILWAACYLFPFGTAKYSISINTIYVLLILFHLFFFGLSLTEGIRLTKFEGVFTNPNALGGSAATLTMISIAFLLDNELNDRKYKYIALGYIGLLSGIFFALITTSRTSNVVILIQIGVLFLILLKRSILKKPNKIVLIMASLLLIGFFLYLFTDLGSLVDKVINKFIVKAEKGFDREDKWDYILDRAKFWGNGEATSIAAHNTYLSMLDQYGYLAFGSWILFVVSGLFKSIRQLLKGVQSSYLPFFSFLTFSIVSFTEGMMLKTMMLICVFCLGLFGKTRREEYRNV